MGRELIKYCSWLESFHCYTVANDGQLTHLNHAAVEVLRCLVFTLFHHDLECTSVMLADKGVP